MDLLIVTSLISFLLGIGASILAAAIYTAWQNRNLTKRFSEYKGRYTQCDLRGEPLNGMALWTEITNVDRRLLTVKGNDLGGLEWVSKILMNERFPGFGLGHYHYPATAESDWGLHTIIIVDEGTTILVQVQNMSGGRSNIYTLLWKKTTAGVSKA
jgi:hypothetical protein